MEELWKTVIGESSGDAGQTTRKNEKRRRDFHELLERGLLRPVKQKKLSKSETSISFLCYETSDGKLYDYMKCITCNAVLSVKCGGHLTRHKMKKCAIASSSEIDEYKFIDCDEVNNAIATFCVNSGTNFRVADSSAFQTLITDIIKASNAAIPTDAIVFPSAILIQDLVKKKSLEAIGDIGEEIRRYIRDQDATIVLDFGLLVPNYMSAFLSVLSLNYPSRMNRPTMFPFCFTLLSSVQTTEQVKDVLVKCGDRFGVTEAEITALNVVSDGMRTFPSMGTRYFKSWSLPSSYSLRKLPENVLVPKQSNESQFTLEELVELRKCTDAVDLCSRFASIIHQFKDLLGLPKLPTLLNKSKWVSILACLNDVIRITPLLKDTEVNAVIGVVSEIEKELPRLRVCVEILSKFEPVMNLFERAEPTIQFYLPIITDLNRLCSSREHDDCPTRSVLYKSGRIATSEYLRDEICDIHLKATFLTPSMKKLTKLSEAHRESALRVIKEELEESSSNITEQSRDFSTVNSELVRMFEEQFYPQPHSNEYEEYMAENVEQDLIDDNPVAYWSARRNEYPRLSRMAFSCFSTLSLQNMNQKGITAVKECAANDEQGQCSNSEDLNIMMVATYHTNSQ